MNTGAASRRYNHKLSKGIVMSPIPLYLATPTFIAIPATPVQILPSARSVIIKMLMFKLREIGSASVVYIGDSNSQPLTLYNSSDAIAIDTDSCHYIDGTVYYAYSDATDNNDLPVLETIMLTE